MFGSKQCPLYALIIGINTYASNNFVKLRGSTSDAEAFAEYLQKHLEVPSSHIRLLLNEKASRSAIIDGFKALRNDEKIRKGDAIFIFYAGHGGEAEAPPGWEAGGNGAKIQMIMPQDFSDEQTKEVPGIPDYTIAALLNEIARVKGDNITVVFDSCHSASASRGIKSSTHLVRSANLPPEYHIPSNIDRDIWENTGMRGGGVPPGFRHLGLQSYVLLSACQSFESAQEVGGRGYFSGALLTLFRTIGPDKLKYSEILTRLGSIPNQHPQCEGVNKNRYVFDRKILSPSQKFYTLRRTGDPMKLTIDGGFAHGLSPEAEFTVYPQKDLLGKPLGVLLLEKSQAFSSTLSFTTNHPPFNFGQTAFAIQTKPGAPEALRLFIDPSNRKTIMPLLLHGVETESLSQHFRILDTSPDDAHIAISKTGKWINFSDPKLVRFGMRTQFAKVDPDTQAISRILKGLMHYFWHLNRGDGINKLTGSVRFEFFRLGKSDKIDLHFSPVGNNLCNNNVVDLVVDENDYYGIRLTNDTDFDLFPNLFYFDNSDFSIESYYTCPPVYTKSIQEAPLKKKGTLTLGYGSGGCAPWSYFLREGEDTDVGFLKLFISTEPIDMSDVPQSSSLLTDSSRGVAKSRPTQERLWGTLVIPVIQRRRALY